MSDDGGRGWTKALVGGLAVAAFGFAAPIVWQKVSHRSVGPDHVDTSMRVADGELLIFVRNNSHEPLDLVEAEIELERDRKDALELGVYPMPSQLYRIDSRSAVELKQQDRRLFIKLKIVQAIDPGKFDQFGFKIEGPDGALTPAVGSLSGKMVDAKGNVYRVKY
jgi:hypothetical protein